MCAVSSESLSAVHRWPQSCEQLWQGCEVQPEMFSLVMLNQGQPCARAKGHLP